MARFSRSTINIVVIGFAVMLITGGSRFAIGLVLKPAAEGMDWPRTVLGTAAATFLVVTSVCTFWSGKLADTVNIRNVLAFGLAFSAAGLCLMYTVFAPWQAVIYYGILFAIGNGLASVALVGVLVGRWFPNRLATANALAVSGIGFGQLLVIGVMASFAATVDWRWTFVWLGAANAVLLPLLFIGLPARNLDFAKGISAPAPVIEKTLRAAARTGDLWRLILVYGICGFQDFFVATHVVAFAQDRGISQLLAGNLLAFMGLASVAGVILAGWWSDRASPRIVTLSCFALRVGIFSLIMKNQNEAAILVFGLAYGFTFLQTAPLTVAFVRDAFGMANLGVISGLIVMIHQMAGGLGAYAGAVSFELLGSYDAAFAIMLATSLIALVMSLLLPGKRDQGVA